jgi:putative acetyltransferase
VRLARARGAKRLSAQASDVSRPLFERLKFVAERRSLIQLDEQWLAHTTVTRTLGDDAGPETRH